ncbi:unnamed protein product [Paramecium octaurelia]|uniref:Uncharacterized protein n=1 Tax=Paramecium octaurelia TaxID=43137 RepID=A0A8S1XMT2_PAROT|nr:unnamed protein product [Paramecium octaurelia]
MKTSQMNTSTQYLSQIIIMKALSLQREVYNLSKMKFNRANWKVMYTTRKKEISFNLKNINRKEPHSYLR